MERRRLFVPRRMSEVSVFSSEKSDRPVLTLAYLRECLELDSETGVLTWLRRPREHFANQRAHSTWLVRHAGTVAGAMSGWGYKRIAIRNWSYFAHRLSYALHHAIEPCDLPEFLDHINGERTDNRPVNLRPATRAQNAFNSKKPSSNTSGFKGVSWNAKDARFHARIQYQGALRHLGSFHTAEAAHEAYVAFASEAHGEFYRPEQPIQMGGAS